MEFFELSAYDEEGETSNHEEERKEGRKEGATMRKEGERSTTRKDAREDSWESMHDWEVKKVHRSGIADES